MCVCVYTCVSVCVFVSVGLCAEGKDGEGGAEVTRVVVQMSPQPVEPHEWQLL